MQFTEPKVYKLADTAVDHAELDALLAEIGAPDWETDAVADAELLSEVAGRFCYRSFAVGLNPNVTRVREGNEDYIGNILKQGHGSVIEHGYVSFACLGVSRIVTHEMVRHRLANYSQESLRFVRLDALMMYYPKAFGPDLLFELWKALPPARQAEIAAACQCAPSESFGKFWADTKAQELKDLFCQVVERLEEVQRQIASILYLDDVKDFGIKKKVTSAMRRLAPEGLGTAIILTANHRQWRDIIEKRTSHHAEEEIRVLYNLIADRLFDLYPAFYQDRIVTFVDGQNEITFENRRV